MSSQPPKRGERDRRAERPKRSRERDPAERISAPRTSSEKEAKLLAAELTQLLASKDPWNQDVVFARENLRRHCLALIFQAPASETHVQSQGRKRLSGLNLLFLSTSHAVIHHYRQRLSAMDKLLADQSPSKSASKRGGSDRASNGAPSHAQRRRLLHSFRDFLSKEEKFWRDLLIRIVGVFDVEEARTPLRLLQLGVGDWEPDPQFAGNKEIHDQAILLCHRGLICFGDLARYRELYAEPAKNINNNQQRRSDVKSSQKEDKQGRDWSRAYEAYHQARLLFPDDGNPSNQLAVLASYEGDQLASVYHYYRALAVKKSFVTARGNLGNMLKKVITEWENEATRRRDARGRRNGSYADVDDDGKGTSGSLDIQGMASDFKKQFTLLHAFMFHAAHVEALPNQFTKVTQQFSASVAKRALPSDVIVKATVTAISAWWEARMGREAPKNSEGTAEQTNFDATSRESSALMHALAMIAELLGIAVTELRDVTLHETVRRPGTAPDSERSMLLAQSITAVLRRALPALRISSMWLLSNVDYLARYDTTAASYKPNDPNAPPEVCSAIRGFWSSYATFGNAMSRAFPVDLLPIAAGDLMLEEDIDMLGFAPLRRRPKDASVGKTASSVSAALTSAATASASLHPNEEQSLRLADLVGNANLLVQSDACPVVLDRGQFVIRTKQLNPTSQPWQPARQAAAPVVSPPVDVISESEDESDDEDEDELEDAFDPAVDNTEDDVLDLAMRVATGNSDSAMALNAADDDYDSDEVLWPTRPVPQQQARSVNNTPSPPAPIAPPVRQPAAAATSRTASDLLLQVLQGNPLDLNCPGLPSGQAAPAGSANGVGSFSPFGPGSAMPAVQSIWSSPLNSQVSNAGLGRQPSSQSVGNAGSAEALFNSMPNQNQSQAVKSSPKIAGREWDGFGPGSTAAQGAFANNSVWSAQSPSKQYSALPNSAARAGAHSNAYNWQYG